MIQTEYCQPLSLMPKAAVIAGVKGPRVGPGSVLGGLGNQRVWMSGVGVWSRRTTPFTCRAGCKERDVSKNRNTGLVKCKGWFAADFWD